MRPKLLRVSAMPEAGKAVRKSLTVKILTARDKLLSYFSGRLATLGYVNTKI
jgi:hypothetical protein